MAKTLEEKRKQAAEASKRWRERHPERAKQVQRDAARRQREAAGVKPRTQYETEEDARQARNEYARQWRQKNPDRVLATRKAYYDRHREQQCAKAREWHAKNRDKATARIRVGHLRRSYGLTPEQYAALGTSCGICGATSDSRSKNGKAFRLAVDHDHDTGKVRGLLCGNCNVGIGHFKHDETLLMAATDYLRRTNG